jgi:hypothetical protein
MACSDMHTISPRTSDVTRPLRALPTASPSNAGPADVVVPSVGLRLPRQLPFESWLRIGSHLSAVANSSAWCLGDWLIYGEAAYEGRYRKAIEQTSLDYQTLRNYAWVARSFPMARRRDALSFGHHAEIAALPEAEQDYWLRKAEELSWSRNKLRPGQPQGAREGAQRLPGVGRPRATACPGPGPGRGSGGRPDDQGHIRPTTGVRVRGDPGRPERRRVGGPGPGGRHPWHPRAPGWLTLPAPR